MPVRLTNRFSADRDLGPARVDTNFEDVRRWSGDVDASIEAEAAARTSAIGSINTELEAQFDFANALQSDINTEITNRANADVLLSDAIVAVENDVAAATGFCRVRATGQSVPSSTFTAMNWTVHTGGTNWVVSSNQILPNVNAVYTASAFSQWPLGGFTGGTSRCIIRINHSTAGIVGELRIIADSSTPYMTIPCIPHRCNGTTEYFFVTVWQNTGAPQIPAVDFAVWGIAP